MTKDIHDTQTLDWVDDKQADAEDAKSAEREELTRLGEESGLSDDQIEDMLEELGLLEGRRLRGSGTIDADVNDLYESYKNEEE